MKEEFTDKTENPSLIKILAHGLVWAFLLLFPLPNFGLNSSYFLQTLLQSLLLATLFYFNLYWLIPRYLSKSRALHYFVILLGASALIIVFSESINMMFEPVIPQVSLPGPPPYSPAETGPPQMLPFLLPTILKTILVVAISICFALLDDYFERDKQKNEQANRKLNDELAILKLQINPHFFFNTLNSIYFLARHKSDQTAGAVLKLSDLMRYIIYDSARPKVALTQELEYIRNYIQIQQLRLHERNRVNYSETGAFDNVMIEPLLLLPFIEKANMKNIAGAFHAKGKKLVVVMNIGGVIETASWKDLPDAILLAWQPGQEAGNSITDILSGKADPSGKLAVTFPVNYSDEPSAKNFPGVELEPQNKPQEGESMGFGRSKPAKVVYEEGIYVGYRYFNTFGVKPSYEFGYGLSYTSFAISNLKLSSSSFNKSLTVTVEVKNTGKEAGKDVVQLYLSAPVKKLDKPAEELKGFAKTKLLAPGESETLTFTLDARNLASFNPDLSAWIADAGKYTVKIGASSFDIKQSGTFTLARDLTVKTESRSLLPVEKIDELKYYVK